MAAASEPMQQPHPRQETPARLMDAAELLFAEHGVEAVSFRQLAQAAGANVAAVHYHFGSREALLEAVLERRMVRIAQRRAALLDEQRSVGDRATVAHWVRILVVPLQELIEREGIQGQAYIRLMWRCQSDRPAWVEQLAHRYFDSTIKDFNRRLVEALPHLGTTVLHQRALLASRLTFDVLAGNQPGEHAMEQLQQFVCAGLAAP